MMDLTGYLRFSPTNNAENSNSLELQRELITEWAATQGHVIIRWCEDAGISGADDLSVRRGLFEAIESLKSGSQGIVVRELSRFSRDTIMQESLFRDIRNAGGRVFSTKPSENDVLDDDGSDPGREMIRVILGAVNQYQRKVITANMARGRELASRQQKYAYGAPGYGWKSAPHPSGKGSQLVEVPAEQRVIARIRELRDSGLSIRKVATALNDEGIPSRHGSWAPSSVEKVLKRT